MLPSAVAKRSRYIASIAAPSVACCQSARSRLGSRDNEMTAGPRSGK